LLQSLLHELGLPQSPTIVLCDNLSATYLSVNHIRHSRSKHVEIDIHFVRDYVAIRVLDVRFVSTKHQLTDILAKPLSILRFSILKNKLSVLSNPLRLRGVLEISMTTRDSCETCDHVKETPHEIKQILKSLYEDRNTCDLYTMCFSFSLNQYFL